MYNPQSFVKKYVKELQNLNDEERASEYIKYANCIKRIDSIIDESYFETMKENKVEMNKEGKITRTYNEICNKGNIDLTSDLNEYVSSKLPSHIEILMKKSEGSYCSYDGCIHYPTFGCIIKNINNNK